MPGVPPDAANIVKRVFKGIFKRGKNKRQDGTSTPGGDSTSAPPHDHSSSAPPASTSPVPQVDTKPPQLPPIGNASPLQGATESSSMKAVPPTHPLETGEHEKPQEAVAVDRSADPAPGAPLGGGGGEGAGTAETTTGGLKEPEKLGVGSAGAAGGSSGPGDVSPPVSTVEAGDAPKSGAVSAISKEDAPKASTEAVADGVVGDSGKTAESMLVEPATQAPATGAGTTTTEMPDPAPAASKENVSPQVNGTSSANASTDAPAASSTTESTPAAAQPATTDPTKPTTTDTTKETTKTAPSDEKMPTTMEEPPPIKSVRTAPGMSATSGPLEDFPEGGDAKD